MLNNLRVGGKIRAGFAVMAVLTAAVGLAGFLGLEKAQEMERLARDRSIRPLETLRSGDAKALKRVRSRFMKAHGKVFLVLGVMQWFWYSSEKRRERFVKICEDRDVQQLTFESYMNKELVRKKPMAHVRIFFKDVAHLLGFARV